MSRLEPEAPSILDDPRVMGVYAGLDAIAGARKLIGVHQGDREKARRVASRRAYDHPEPLVRRWWEQVAIAIEGWKDTLALLREGAMP